MENLINRAACKKLCSRNILEKENKDESEKDIIDCVNNHNLYFANSVWFCCYLHTGRVQGRSEFGRKIS